MSKGNKKQHILAKSYLKYFSINEDGKDLHVINLKDKYFKNIKLYNSGDRPFWEKNYYDSFQMRNRKFLERLFNEIIENGYDEMISEISKERPIENSETKYFLFRFIYYSIYRSPAMREKFRRLVEYKKLIKKFSKNESDKANLENDIGDELLAKELHLGEMVNKEKMYANFDQMCKYLSVKRWEILKAPDDRYWMISDNPAVEVKLKDEGLEVRNNWEFSTLDSMYIPLTKKYCLHIYPYSQDDDASLNINNTSIGFRVCTNLNVINMNRWSFATMNRLLIAPNYKTMQELAFEIERIKNSI